RFRRRDHGTLLHRRVPDPRHLAGRGLRTRQPASGLQLQLGRPAGPRREPPTARLPHGAAPQVARRGGARTRPSSSPTRGGQVASARRTTTLTRSSRGSYLQDAATQAQDEASFDVINVTLLPDLTEFTSGVVTFRSVQPTSDWWQPEVGCVRMRFL